MVGAGNPSFISCLLFSKPWELFKILENLVVSASGRELTYLGKLNKDNSGYLAQVFHLI